MPPAMKPCCPGTGCGLSPSRSTSMISKTSATCWVPLSPFHIQPSHLAPSTRYKCGLNLSLRHFCGFFFLKKRVCIFYSFQIVLPPHLERIREKLAENSHELWAVTRIEQGWTYGPVRAHRTGYFSADSEKLICTLTIFYRGFSSFVMTTRSCTPVW